MKTKDEPLTAEGLILDCLTEAYFRRAKYEGEEENPRITKELDILQNAIRHMKSKLNNEKNTK